MIIYNIREDINVQLYLKDIDGYDIGVFLKPGQFVFCPNDDKTKSINLQNIKRNIGIVMEEKPFDAEYFVIYDKDKRFFMYPQKLIQEKNLENENLIINKILKDKKIILNKKTLFFSKNKINIAKKKFIHELDEISKDSVKNEISKPEIIEIDCLLLDVVKEVVKSEEVLIEKEILSIKESKIKENPIKKTILKEKKPLTPKVKIVSKPRNFILKNKKK